MASRRRRLRHRTKRPTRNNKRGRRDRTRKRRSGGQSNINVYSFSRIDNTTLQRMSDKGDLPYSR